MNNPKKRITVLLLCGLFVIFSNQYGILCSAGPPAPRLIDVNPSGNEGDYFIGAIPPDDNPDKPVLVFVQGLGGSAASWWGATKYYGDNDMYQYAYNAGYRTAFVNFRDADGNPGDMWRNGSVLRNQLEAICRYYGVARVNLICHSKGGIDAQAAITHYGAAAYVAKVFTLSTPHWGSQLADLAYSSDASWLARLLDSQNDGTNVLQTAYMSCFRSVTDELAAGETVAYYTSAGTGWGPFLSELYWGGIYLNDYDRNDGAVTVTSAHNPRAVHIITGSKFNHDNIRMGRRSWRYIEPEINSLQIAKRSLSPQNILPDGPNVTNFFTRGGLLSSATTIAIPVDSLTGRINIDLLVANPGTALKVIAPDGTGYRLKTVYSGTDFFKGAVHKQLAVANPQTGYWQLQMAADPGNAFFLIVYYQSTLQFGMKAARRRAKVKSAFNFGVEIVPGKSGVNIGALAATVRLRRVAGRFKGKLGEELAVVHNDQGMITAIQLPDEPGLYNVSLEVKGSLTDGTPFARSQACSVLVESEQLQGVRLLKSLAGAAE
jgi:pimeloyl-ACP methyl ester carboxylesterase